MTINSCKDILIMNFGTIEPNFKIPEFQSSKILKMTQRQATSFESAFILLQTIHKLRDIEL